MDKVTGAVTEQDVLEKVAEIEEYVKKYEWEDKVVHPYGFPIPLLKFLANMKTYRQMTDDSKDIVVDELNGLIEHCINPWIKQEEEPKMQILLSNGKIKTVGQSFAEMLIGDGLAVAM